MQSIHKANKNMLETSSGFCIIVFSLAASIVPPAVYAITKEHTCNHQQARRLVGKGLF